MNLLEDGGDPTASMREELAAKWADKPKEEVLKAKIEADLHIKALEREAAERHQMYTQLYEESKTKASLEALIDRSRKKKNFQ